MLAFALHSFLFINSQPGAVAGKTDVFWTFMTVHLKTKQKQFHT